MKSPLPSVFLILAVASSSHAQPECSIRQITDTTEGSSGSPSLQGSTIAFASNADLTGGNPDGNPEIFLYDGFGFEQITDTVTGGSSAPELDDGAIAFWSDSDHAGENADGSREIFLYDGATIRQVTHTTASGIPPPSFDDGMITFSSRLDLTGENPDGNWEIFFWDGVGLHQVTVTTDPFGSGTPVVSGGTIAFTSAGNLTGGNPEGNAEVFYWDGSTIEQITTAPFSHALGLDHRDGSVAFTSFYDFTGDNPESAVEIFLWEGGTIQQVTNYGLGKSNRPRLGGGSIAFLSESDFTGRNPELDWELFLLWDGTFHQLTETAGLDNRSIRYSADGPRVAFSTRLDLVGGNPDGNTEVYLAICEPPPLFSKSFLPDAIGAGQTSTLSFGIDNGDSAAAAEGLAFTDELPPGLEVAAAPAPADTCGGTLTAVPGSTTISYTGGTVGAGESCELSLGVTATEPDLYPSTSGDLTSTLGNSGPASAELRVVAQPVLSKSFAPGRVDEPGGTTTVVLTLDHTAGALPATDLTLIDDLPGGMVIADPANATTDCAGGTIDAAPGTATISYTGGTVGAGDVCVVMADVAVLSSGAKRNTATSSSVWGPTAPSSAVLEVGFDPLDVPVLDPHGLALLAALLVAASLWRLRS